MSDDGFSAGAEGSEGDPRVVLAMNAVLSTAFAALVVWGLSFLGTVEFSLLNVATGAIVVFALTYAVTQ
ncbi:hypothetical protein [Halomicrobium urmianum]|uniref:hypothetical protein n=1 Tax=Halomicrobium urmianum TaxID=1586233 RepID=UPI001CD98FC4|nr:hypothetical protein [Halomicrobium urmianum]